MARSPPTVTPEESTLTMRRSSSAPRRATGPVIVWGLAAVIAVATGTAYATGFVASSSTAVDARDGMASPLFGEPPNPEFDLYPNAVTSTDLVIGFDVLWGQLAHDTKVFTVTLPANDPRTGNPYPGGTTFALNIYATNRPDVVNGAGGHTPWTNLTIQWTIAPCLGG